MPVFVSRMTFINFMCFMRSYFWHKYFHILERSIVLEEQY